MHKALLLILQEVEHNCWSGNTTRALLAQQSASSVVLRCISGLQTASKGRGPGSQSILPISAVLCPP